MLQFGLQGLAIGLLALVQVAVEIVLEEVDQDVENAVFHYLFPGSLRP